MPFAFVLKGDVAGISGGIEEREEFGNGDVSFTGESLNAFSAGAGFGIFQMDIDGPFSDAVPGFGDRFAAVAVGMMEVPHHGKRFSDGLEQLAASCGGRESVMGFDGDFAFEVLLPEPAKILCGATFMIIVERLLELESSENAEIGNAVLIGDAGVSGQFLMSFVTGDAEGGAEDPDAAIRGEALHFSGVFGNLKGGRQVKQIGESPQLEVRELEFFGQGDGFGEREFGTAERREPPYIITHKKPFRKMLKKFRRVEAPEL